MDPTPQIIGFVILLLIFYALSYGVKKVSKKSGVKPFKTIGLEGQGLIKRIVELDVVKDGDFLKANMSGRQFTVATSPVMFEDLKGKEKLGYIVDLDKACTVSLQKAGSVIDLKTNPQLVSNVMDSGLIREAFGIHPHRGLVILIALISIGFGIIIGLAF